MRRRSRSGWSCYGGRLLAVARRLLGSRADAEDAVQRALLQCYTAGGASSYQPRWAVSTWLYRIFTNVCVDELRRRGTRTAYDASRAALEPAHPREPRQDLDLHRALARVLGEARVLLALRYAQGLSYAELARIRGISVNTGNDPARARQGIAARGAQQERSPP